MSCIFALQVSFAFRPFVRMPVYCIAYDCDNTQRNAPGVSFHRLPLKKPSLLKQVINVLNGELHLTPLFFSKWLDKLRLVDPPIYKANACRCM